jgi:parvulin-like peptidyl-prolyl isomerase
MAKLGTVCGILLAWIATAGLAANPYAPVRTINGAVITDYDISQRANLLDALGADGDLRGLALDQLTEDRIKVQSADRLGIELPEDAVLGGIEEFATARGLSIDEVLDILANRDIDRQAMDDFVEAGLVWREVVSARFRGRAQPTDAEIDAALAARANTPVEIYYLGEIALPFAERGQQDTEILAQQLVQDLTLGADFGDLARQFSRSETAQNGGAIPPMTLEAMPPPMRSLVQKLSEGQVSEPLPITGGVSIVKILDIRRELPKPDPDVTEFERREAVRRELFIERITAYGEGYMQELLSDALIVEQ